ncbi:MAG: hypothetical protein ACI9KE_005197 [Polyangiales bacterium]
MGSVVAALVKACQKSLVSDSVIPSHPWLVRKGGHVFLQSYPARFSDEELAVFLDYIHALPPILPAPYGWVIELGGIFRASMRQRKAVQARQDENLEISRRNNAGTAIVADNAIKRGLVRATYLMKAQVFPVKVVSSVDEGIEWVRSQLAQRGVDAR